MSEALFVEERRRAILNRLKQNGRVSVRALSDEMNVSTVTIRQDLRVLEEEGLLERTYGGAVPRQPGSEESPPEAPFDIRNTERASEKTAIARLAAQMVTDGQAIALDASTTAYALVPFLKQFNKLTLITNSLIIAQSFPDKSGIEVLIPGGRLRKDSVSLVGRPDGLPDINLNLGFFGARGLSIQGGMSDSDPDEVAMKRAMIAHCIHTIVIVDSSKWGQVAPYTVLPGDGIEHVISTTNAPAELVEQFRQANTRVDLAPLD
ncbi:MAG: DeoR/GlpR family DNA-binding transcription regulator [Anaerolineae bacterium]|nr:DeoR/GlpR family DNA-binding transcription regulator [Anaerolineae bacterium]